MLAQAIVGFIRPITFIVIVAFVAVDIFFFWIRPGYLKWGATADEINRSMPGDELVPTPKMFTTRAINIKAPVDKVWPWLAQLGYHRAGWYNHDWINHLMGAGDYVDGHRSANRIIPELQDLKVGDAVLVAPNMGWTVMDLQPRRLLVFLARADFQTGQTFDLAGPRPGQYLNSSQLLLLEETGPQTTRLIVRDRLDFDMGKWSVMNYILEPGFFIQESAFMKGVKKRAEALAWAVAE